MEGLLVGLFANLPVAALLATLFLERAARFFRFFLGLARLGFVRFLTLILLTILFL